jgi:hypothetical protein
LIVVSGFEKVEKSGGVSRSAFSGLCVAYLELSDFWYQR